MVSKKKLKREIGHLQDEIAYSSRDINMLIGRMTALEGHRIDHFLAIKDLQERLDGRDPQSLRGSDQNLRWLATGEVPESSSPGPAPVGDNQPHRGRLQMLWMRLSRLGF